MAKLWKVEKYNGKFEVSAIGERTYTFDTIEEVREFAETVDADVLVYAVESSWALGIEVYAMSNGTFTAYVNSALNGYRKLHVSKSSYNEFLVELKEKCYDKYPSMMDTLLKYEVGII